MFIKKTLLLKNKRVLFQLIRLNIDQEYNQLDQILFLKILILKKVIKDFKEIHQ